LGLFERQWFFSNWFTRGGAVVVMQPALDSVTPGMVGCDLRVLVHDSTGKYWIISTRGANQKPVGSEHEKTNCTDG